MVAWVTRSGMCMYSVAHVPPTASATDPTPAPIIYIYSTLLSNNEKYVDANLDALNNAISGNEPSSEM